MNFNELIIENGNILINNISIPVKPFYFGGYDNRLLKNNPYIPNILGDKFTANTILYSKLDNDYFILSGHYMLNSLLKYINNEYSIKRKYFDDLTEDKQKLILNTNINFSYYDLGELGEFQLLAYLQQTFPKFYNKQEQINMIMKGAWLDQLMETFANKDSIYAYLFDKYIPDSWERCGKLTYCIKMIAGNTSVREYMACNRKNDSIEEIVHKVVLRIWWIRSLFENIVSDCSIFKSIDIGYLYDKYSKYDYNKDIVKKRFLEAISYNNEPAFKWQGAFEYALRNNDKKQILYKRFFPKSMLIEKFAKNPVCAICGKPIESFDEVEGDHIKPWTKGGLTTFENCQITHKICNIKKGVKVY